MKTLLTITAIQILTASAVAQRVWYGYTEIKKGQYDTCSKTSCLLANAHIKKQSGKLTIPLIGKPAKVFKDDNSDENFHEFDYLGDIKDTKLSLVKRTDYNHEDFYLLNRSTGAIDTLIGEPIFAQNMRGFACINNPGTDEEQQVQIGEINKGSVNTLVALRGKADTFLEGITCIGPNFLYTRDNQGRYWKLIFKIGNK